MGDGRILVLGVVKSGVSVVGEGMWVELAIRSGLSSGQYKWVYYF